MASDWIELVEPIVQQIAREYARRYHQYGSTYADCYQEAYIWCMEHPRQRDQYLKEDNIPALALSMRRAVKRMCESAKAAWCGYELRDLHYYTRQEVAGDSHGNIKGCLLQCMFDRNAWTNPPVRELGDVPKGRRDPSEGNNWIAMLADVCRAWEALPRNLRGIVRLRYAQEYTVQKIADEEGLTFKQARRALDKAIDRIMDLLGGEKGEA